MNTQASLTSCRILQNISHMQKYLFFVVVSFACLYLGACDNGGFFSNVPYGSPNMGGPSSAERATKIANEPTGDFFYGRRYYIKKTRFWGYLRKPRENANKAKLVMFNERKKTSPDRFSEVGPAGQRFGFDQNYEYKIYGRYSGQIVYEVNSNQFLPEFILTGYKVTNKDPGWLFSPSDPFNPDSITLRP